MLTKVITCDICKIEKSESNNWLMVMLNRGNPVGFVVYPWMPEEPLDQFKHVCGQECAHKILGQWLEAQHNA